MGDPENMKSRRGFISGAILFIGGFWTGLSFGTVKSNVRVLAWFKKKNGVSEAEVQRVMAMAAQVRRPFLMYTSALRATLLHESLNSDEFIRVTEWKSIEEMNAYINDPQMQSIFAEFRRLGYSCGHRIISS